MTWPQSWSVHDLAYEGNKSDLVDERAVTSDSAADFARQEGIFFMEVSALNNKDDCVNKAFNLLIEGNTRSLI